MSERKPGSGNVVSLDDHVLEQVASLTRIGSILARENAYLRQRIEELEREIDEKDDFGGFSYDELCEMLGKEQTELAFAGSVSQLPLLSALFMCRRKLAAGVANSEEKTNRDCLIFSQVASRLLVYGLVQSADAAMSGHERVLHLSDVGARFVSRLVADIGRQRRTRDSR